MPKVVITLPAYQAERTLEQTVAAIPPGVADEVILVDDASRDATADVARRLGLGVHVHPTNRGYGGNQKTCYSLALHAGADIVVLLHPDYQYEPKAVPLLIAPILAGEADMTFGSRFAGMGDPLRGGMPRYRYIGNRVTTTAQNLLLGARFTDMHSGMRAYTRQALLALPFLAYPEDFSFDAELLIDAVSAGLRVVEVPIPTRYTKESSSISVSRSLRYIRHGTAHAAKRAVVRGRRGARYLPSWQESPAGLTARGQAVVARCVACGHDRMHVRYHATATGPAPIDEFRCTTAALGAHDEIVECPACGLLSSLPTMAADDIREAYAHAVDEEYLAEEEARKELFDWVLDRIEGYLTFGHRLLEIGSNVGLFLKAAADRGWAASGVEPSSWAVETGRDRYGVDIRAGLAEEANEPVGSVDVLVMLDVLEHLNDPARVLRHVRPMVKDEGLLALSTINVDSIHGRLRGERWPWFIRSHLHYFRPATLVAMLGGCGFDVVEWLVVPRTFHLSYIVRRAAGTLPGASLVGRLAARVDPAIPVGWLGDITLVLARPRPAAGGTR